MDDSTKRNKICLQLDDFHYARGLFGNEFADTNRRTMPPADWWELYGEGCPELKRFAIRVLSLTCSSFRYERNWSSFEMVIEVMTLFLDFNLLCLELVMLLLSIR